MQYDQNFAARKAIPLSSSRLRKILIHKSLLDTLNYRQLTSLYMYCVDLRELELTGVFKNIQKEIPRDFMDNLRNLAMSPVA